MTVGRVAANYPASGSERDERVRQGRRGVRLRWIGLQSNLLARRGGVRFPCVA